MDINITEELLEDEKKLDEFVINKVKEKLQPLHDEYNWWLDYTIFYGDPEHKLMNQVNDWLDEQFENIKNNKPISMFREHPVTL